MDRIDFLEENYDDFLMAARPIGYGVEARVLELDDEIYKIFHRYFHKRRTLKRIRKLHDMTELSDILTLPEKEVYLDFSLIGYTMKYGGETLAHYLAYNELTISDKLIILDKLKEAIIKMHEYGLTHGDIQTSNILIDDDKNIKITDLNNIMYKYSFSGHLNYISRDIEPYYRKKEDLDILCFNYIAYLITCFNIDTICDYQRITQYYPLILEKELSEQTIYDKNQLTKQLRLIQNPEKYHHDKPQFITDFLR